MVVPVGMFVSGTRAWASWGLSLSCERARSVMRAFEGELIMTRSTTVGIRVWECDRRMNSKYLRSPRVAICMGVLVGEASNCSRNLMANSM